MKTSIFYWKIDDQQMNEVNLLKDAGDIVGRSSFESIYLGLTHVKKDLLSREVVKNLMSLSKLFHAHKRKLILDADARQLFRFGHVEGEKAGYITLIEIPLNALGAGKADVSAYKGACVLSAWAVQFQSGCAYHARNEIAAKVIDNTLFVPENPRNALKTAVVCVFYDEEPDIFSDGVMKAYEKMYAVWKDIHYDGVAIDEWGFNRIQMKDSLWWANSFYYSRAMGEMYAARYGKKLDFMHLVYYPDGDFKACIEAVNEYVSLYRDQLSKTDEQYYYLAKKHLGKDAFIGVHPTFWGDDTCIFFDAVHNGLDWWKIRRDYAQTDECVVYPAKLALAHKWGGDVWYNMWYQDNLDTFYREAWELARFGGRIHYLGYRDHAYEANLLEASQPGQMEKIDALSKSVQALDAFQKTLPDSRVLLLFGWENAANWKLSNPDSRLLVRNEGKVSGVLKFAKYLFEKGYLCDLVPTYEIEDGSLRIENGRAVYGQHDYDAVVLLHPDGISKKAVKWMLDYARINKLSAMIGDIRYLSDGTSGQEDNIALSSAVTLKTADKENYGLLFDTLAMWGVSKNKYANGCVFEDGGAIFTSSGGKENGNPLCVNEEVSGHRLVYRGEDYLGIRLSDKGEILDAVFTGARSLMIDGREHIRDGKLI